MKIFDADCFLGHWPFHRIPTGGNEWLLKTAKDNGIESMLVSSFNSIFYDDPEEGDDELAEELRENQYHAITIDLMRPSFPTEVEKEALKFNPKAVRICPVQHGYSLTAPEVMRLTAILKELNLPLIVTAILDDPRITRFGPRRNLDNAEIESMLQNMTHIPVIFANVLPTQLGLLGRQNEEFGSIYATISRFTYPADDEIMAHAKELPTSNMLFGSAFPLYARKSTVNIVTMGGLPQDVCEDICWNNAAKLFGL